MHTAPPNPHAHTASAPAHKPGTRPGLDHGHAHGHGHDHGHPHGHGVAGAMQPALLGDSLLCASAVQRLAWAALPVVLVWALVAWVLW